jgi:hypothetical protein
MFVICPLKHYFNGKMGVIKSLGSQEILVHFPEENKTIEVEKYEWQNIRYKVDQEIEEEVWELLCIILSNWLGPRFIKARIDF